MRTKILKYFGMVVVLIIMVNLTSCEVSIESWYDDDDYSENILQNHSGTMQPDLAGNLGTRTVNTTHND